MLRALRTTRNVHTSGRVLGPGQLALASAASPRFARPDLTHWRTRLSSQALERRYASSSGGGPSPGSGFPKFMLQPEHQKGDALKEYVRQTSLLSTSTLTEVLRIECGLDGNGKIRKVGSYHREGRRCTFDFFLLLRQTT